MDPISQGTVGAAFAQSSANKHNIVKISVIGFIAGLAPDLDVLIRSSTDPILSLEYHRQFTHSLIFVPLGALIVTLLLYPLFRKSISLKTVYLASFLGYATHGLLDACTSYGTLLFWPFSNERVTWNNISIVDPLFTIPILILIGFVQYDRALKAANELALLRGHNPERLTLKPSFGNLILWKSIYQHQEKFYVDAIRTVRSSTWCMGESVGIFDYQRHLPNLNKDSQQKKDIERFRWFSQDYLSFDEEKNLVTDVRYSMIPNQIAPMWGLVIDNQRGIDKHAIWWTSRGLEQGQLDIFKQMLSGKNCRDRVLAF
jgi:inner membrane protein